MNARNIANLDGTVPGSSRAFVLSKDGEEKGAEFLVDGRGAEVPPGPATAWGVRWAVPHMLDGAALFFPKEALPDPDSLRLEVFDGLNWVAWADDLKVEVKAKERCIKFAFEPVATTALRVRLMHGAAAATKIEVYRRVVAKIKSCPERLAQSRELEEELLARPEEPSFETLSLLALPCPMWATVGFKDLSEVGVFWDGTLAVPRLSPRISFELGAPPRPLADYRETLRRELADGWRPAVVLRGRAGQVAFTQKTFCGLAGGEKSETLFVRFEFANLSDARQSLTFRTTASIKKGKAFTLKGSGLYYENKLVIAAAAEARAGEGPSLEFDLSLPPKGSQTLELRAPLCDEFDDEPTALFAKTFDRAYADFERSWDDLLAPAMRLEVPEPRLNDFYRAIVCQIFMNGDGNIMPYGSYPSWYDGKLFGVEEAYCMQGLAFSGFVPDTQRYLDGTYLTKEFLHKVEEYTDKSARHQQYRNGLVPMAAAQAYFVSRDKEWIRKHLPLLVECADWTVARRKKTMVEVDGERPLHWGLLPKWAFGGDIHKGDRYPIYANVACLRGLVDTAQVLEDLGENERAAGYRREAEDYRKAIERAMDGSYLPDEKPPVLPLSLYISHPTNDFYQLFASLMLDVDILDSKRAGYLARFMEEDNRLFCGMCRFRGGYGPGGLDAIYTLGYFKHLLRQGRVERFLLGFYALMAFNLERTCFTSRETNVLYTADRMRDLRGTDPLPCSSAVALHLLRHMLVLEETAESGEPSGSLLLFGGAPRRWFNAGQKISVQNAPTYFGPMSVTMKSHVEEDRVEIDVVPPTRGGCTVLKVRVPHPERKAIKKVTVNGKEAGDVDAEREIIELRPSAPLLRITVQY